MGLKIFFSIIVSIISLPVLIQSYQKFQDSIPNGHAVPNPCDPSSTWPGVGHQNKDGGGQRNPFGRDFQANNYTWTKALCQMDSDGDGLSNGIELGDTNCTWSKNNTNSTALRVKGLSHPGICDPPMSAKCMNTSTWQPCKPKFNCTEINKSGVRNMTLRFPRTTIPAKPTTYSCFAFALPNDTVYDIIATAPAIDNTMVAHHMLLYACEDSSHVSLSNHTVECEMSVAQGCNSIIGLWSMGADGNCLSNQYGFRIGTGGYQFAVLQIHYTNYDLNTNLNDASGMTLYYTPSLRPNRGDVLMVSQAYLNIPPGQVSVKQTGICSGDCTRALQKSVNISQIALHMHLLGKSGNVSLYRGGRLIKTLINEDHYEYNSPVLFVQDPPIELSPGDSITVECVYDSEGRNTTTNFGPGTMDEMCIGFLIYYPSSTVGHFQGCGQWRSLGYCDRGFLPVPNCDQESLSIIAQSIGGVCNANCSKPCMGLIKTLWDTGCMAGDYLEYLKTSFKGLFDLIQHCIPDGPPNPGECGANGPAPPNPSVISAATHFSVSIISVAFLITMYMY